MKVHVRSRIIRPRVEFGLNWSSERIVIARHDLKELQWWKAGTVRICGQQVSFPSSLILINYVEGTGEFNYITLCEGGRMGMKLFLACAYDINKFFDCTCASYLNPECTVEIML